MNSDQKVKSLQHCVPDVSRETIERLIDLEQFFLRWARTINLVASSTLDDVWSRHILDSAQLWQWRKQTSRWLDLGSGSGFPGLVLAALSYGDGIPTTLVESNIKKSAYLRQAIGYLALNASVLTQRVEDLDLPHMSDSDLTVTARAFAPLTRIFDWTNGLGSPRTRALLHKGRGFQAEVSEARSRWRFDLIERRSLVDSESVILDITALERL